MIGRGQGRSDPNLARFALGAESSFRKIGQVKMGKIFDNLTMAIRKNELLAILNHIQGSDPKRHGLVHLSSEASLSPYHLHPLRSSW
jgi:hypothetical protein